MGGIVGPEGGERVSGHRDHRILVELPELEVVELRFGPDFEGVEPHSHEDQVDSFYVLEGEAEFVTGKTSTPLRRGQIVLAPYGLEYSLRTASRAVLYKAAVPAS